MLVAFLDNIVRHHPRTVLEAAHIVHVEHVLGEVEIVGARIGQRRDALAVHLRSGLRNIGVFDRGAWWGITANVQLYGEKRQGTCRVGPINDIRDEKKIVSE